MLFTGIQNSRGGRSPIGSPGINSLDQLAGKFFVRRCVHMIQSLSERLSIIFWASLP